MRREIKFRAWDSLNGWMVTPGEGDNPVYIYHDNVGPLKLRWNDGRFYDCPFNWMQYTGLKDKNGVEIYEGDILERKDDNNRRFSFEWNADGLAYEPRLVDGADGFYYHKRGGDEVIGNIYENPELLERSA